MGVSRAPVIAVGLLAAIVTMLAQSHSGAQREHPATEPPRAPLRHIAVLRPAPEPPHLRGRAAIADAVAAGRHWRFVTRHGPVHVWIPRNYDPAHAVTVVYVHGYYTDLDGAWTEQRLAAQFALSGLDAMFVACEAPAHDRDDVSWRSLGALLAAVEAHIHVPRPDGRIAAVGHSGAFRTLLYWLDDPALDTVVLLDAAYGRVERFRTWIEASRRHRLIDVGDDTRRWTDELHRALPLTLVLDRVPDALPAEARFRRIVYVRSDVGHMQLVTGGVVLPMLLRALEAPAVSGAPDAALGALP